jgi:hypothetical protein
MSPAVNHPFMKSLERHPPGRRIVKERTIGFERSLGVRQNKKDGSPAVEAGDLKIASIQTEIRIGEDADGMGPVQVFSVQDVIENQGNSQGADFDGPVTVVLQDKSKPQISVTHLPGAKRLQRKVFGKRPGQIGRREAFGSRIDGFDGSSFGGRRIVFPSAILPHSDP